MRITVLARAERAEHFWHQTAFIPIGGSYGSVISEDEIEYSERVKRCASKLEEIQKERGDNPHTHGYRGSYQEFIYCRVREDGYIYKEFINLDTPVTLKDQAFCRTELDNRSRGFLAVEMCSWCRSVIFPKDFCVHHRGRYYCAKWKCAYMALRRWKVAGAKKTALNAMAASMVHECGKVFDVSPSILDKIIADTNGGWEGRHKR